MRNINVKNVKKSEGGKNMFKNYDKEINNIFNKYNGKQETIKKEIKDREEKEKLLLEELKKVERKILTEEDPENDKEKLSNVFKLRKDIKKLNNEISETREEIEYLRASITGLLSCDILKIINDVEEIESKYDKEINPAIEKLAEIKESEKKLKEYITFARGRKNLLKTQCVKISSDILKGTNITNCGYSRTAFDVCSTNPNSVFEILKSIVNKE